MDALLLIVAWAAGIIGLLLVADMIAADLLNRRSERIAARRGEPAGDKHRARPRH